MALDRYGLIAPIYEQLEALWSLGAIQASRFAQTQYIQPGDSILYIGAGCAADAVQSAEKGARVSLLDISEGMLVHAARRFAKHGVTADFIQTNLLDLAQTKHYDVVIANYFLNIFPASRLPEVIAALLGQIRQGGQLMLADFAPIPPGLRGLPAQLNWYIPLTVAHFITGEPLHAHSDYRPYLQAAGLSINHVEDFGGLTVGPKWFRMITATKPNA